MPLAKRILLSNNTVNDRTIGAEVGALTVVDVFLPTPTPDRTVVIPSPGSNLVQLKG